MTVTKALSASRAPRTPAHAVNWLDTLHNFNEALPLRQKWHKLKPLLPAEHLEAPEGQGVYLVFALVDNDFLTAVHAGSADAEHGLKSRLHAHAKAAEHGAQGVEWSKQDGNFFMYALGTQSVKLLYSYSCVTPMEGAQGYEARLLWLFDFFGTARLNGGFGVEGARLGAPPTSDWAAEGKRWCEAFMKSIKQHMVKPQLCKTFEEQVEFSVADSEGEAAAVISAIQRRSARLLQLAEDLQLACHSARNMTGYQALQLKQQLAAWNDAAADRHALGEAGLEGICRGIEQLLDGGSAVSEYKLAEEATLNNKVDAASLLVDAAGPKSGALGLPRSPSSAALLTRSPSSAELGAGRAPSAGASRRGSLTEPPSRGASGGQLTPKPNSLDIPRSPSLSRAGSLKEPPPLSPSSSARKLAPLPELARVPSMRHVSSDQCIKPGASLAPGFPSAFPSAFPAASKMSMAIAERFVGRAGWEADCWQLYLAVSEAAIAGSTRGFPFTVTADQLVDAYALNDHQASSLRGRLDRARGDSADETLRLCCYLGSMRAGATEHERLHQQLLELEACNGKKAYTALGNLAVFTAALQAGDKKAYQAAADQLLAELKRQVPRSSPLVGLFNKCKVLRTQGELFPAPLVEIRGG